MNNMFKENIWECVIVRKHKIDRAIMEFSNYTDWTTDRASGRLNMLNYGDFILTVSGEPIITVSEEEIERVKI